MFKVLFLLFIVVPIVEIALLIQVSDVIGGFATIALVIITAILGAKLVKQQGIGAYVNVQQQMAQGQMPASDLFTGICVIVAGVLLLTPGIMTDALGFLLLTPAVRQKLASSLIEQATAKMQAGMFNQQSPFQSNPFEGRGDSHTFDHSDNAQNPFSGQTHNAPSKSDREQNNTIEGEYQRKE